MRKITFLCVVILITTSLKSQAILDLSIKEGTKIRIESDSKLSKSTTIHITIPKKDGDTFFTNAILSVECDLENSTVNKSSVSQQLNTSLTLKLDTGAMQFSYTVNYDRDSVDDKKLVLKLLLKKAQTASNEIALQDAVKKIEILIKPVIKDKIVTNNNWEFWLMTGTNFDPFNGIKTEEFFFRANALFKHANSGFYSQFAFYKNRYYTTDSTSNSTFRTATRPAKFDSVYTYQEGTYKTNISQTTDPIGFQYDLLYNLTGSELANNSNFFLSAGFDYSTTTTTIRRINNNFDTLKTYQTTKPDSAGINLNSYPNSIPDVTLVYKKPSYNLNFGFMWIMDETDINIKAQLNFGISSYYNLAAAYMPRGSNQFIYSYSSQSSPYIQSKVYATVKTPGITFGFEMFARKSEFPAFNFTLSKTFDLKSFSKLFAPVSAIVK